MLYLCAMYKRLLILMVLALGIFTQTSSFAAKHKKQVKKKHTSSIAHKKTSKKKKSSYYAKNSRKHKKSKHRKGYRLSSEELAADRAKRSASKDMIAQNLEKKKQTDSAHKLVFVNVRLFCKYVF